MIKQPLCTYCRVRLTRPTATNHASTMATRDHVFPKSRGGIYTVPCCLRCNNMKADTTPREWQKFRDENPHWREMRNGGDVAASKKQKRAEIFARLRIQKIQPAWPLNVHVQMPPLCRGLA